jgi:cold shock CspA family protein
MTRGAIKTIRDDKGFGSIAPDDGGQEPFFHGGVVEGGVTFDSLCQGQRVEYTAATDPRNPGRTRAERVQLAAAESSSP